MSVSVDGGHTFLYNPSSAPITSTILSIISFGSNCPFMMAAKLARMSLSPGEMNGVVVPVVRRVGHPIVESRVVGAGVDGLNGDSRGRQLVAHRGSDPFQRVLAGTVGAQAISGEHSSHRTDEHDASLDLGLEKLATTCCAMARLEKTFVSNVRRTRSTGISEIGPPSPIAALLTKVSNGQWSACLMSRSSSTSSLSTREPVAEAEFLALSLQIGGLRPDVRRCEYAMASLGKSDGCAPAQPATSSRDQYVLHAAASPVDRDVGATSSLPSRQRGSRYFAVLRRHAARHADCADQGSVGGTDGDAAGVWDQAAVRALSRGCRPARFAVFPEGLAGIVEQHGRFRFSEGDIDRTENRLVHSREREQVTACIDDGDVHRHADCLGVRACTFGDRLGFLQRTGAWLNSSFDEAGSIHPEIHRSPIA